MAMFVRKKPWFWTSWTLLIIHQAHTASINGLPEGKYVDQGGVKEVLNSINYDVDSLDYEAEDTAKQRLLSEKRYEEKSVKISPSWISDSRLDLRYLCKNETHRQEKVFECTKRHGINFICFDNTISSLKLCDRQDIFPRALCINVTSKVVVTCDYPRVPTCHGSVDKSKMVLCQEPTRFFCLWESPGYIEPCQQGVHSNYSAGGYQGKIKKDGEEKTTFSNGYYQGRDWWKEWLLHEAEVPEPEKGIRLCKTEKDKLVKCENGPKYSPVCVGDRSCEVRTCSQFPGGDVPVPVCIETNSSKVMTCGDFIKAFLCFPIGYKMNHLSPCKSSNRQACVGKNAQLEKCTPKHRHNERRVSVQKHSTIVVKSNVDDIRLDKVFEWFKQDPKWKKWWQEYVYDGNYTNIPNEPVDSLCIGESAFSNLIDCKKELSNSTACISVADGAINACKSFKTSDTAVSLCLESSTNKIITCSNFTNVYLCWPTEDSSIARPCNDVVRHICLTEEGKFRKCTNMPKKQNITFSRMHYKVSNQDNLRKDKYLCFTDGHNNSFQRCQVNSPLIACLNTEEWALTPCEEVKKEAEIGIPVCFQGQTNHVVTCGEINEVNLCYPPGDSALVKPCESRSKMICVGENDKIETCPHALEENKTPLNQTIFEDINDHMRILNEEGLGFEILCVSAKVDNNVIRCEEEDDTEVACIGAPSGEILSCLNASSDPLKFPVCRNIETRELYTCGKFSTGHLCYLHDKVIEHCQVEDRYICLTKRGKLQKCKEVDKEEEDKSVNEFDDYEYKDYGEDSIDENMKSGENEDKESYEEDYYGRVYLDENIHGKSIATDHADHKPKFENEYEQDSEQENSKAEEDEMGNLKIDEDEVENSETDEDEVENSKIEEDKMTNSKTDEDEVENSRIEKDEVKNSSTDEDELENSKIEEDEVNNFKSGQNRKQNRKNENSETKGKRHQYEGDWKPKETSNHESELPDKVKRKIKLNRNYKAKVIIKKSTPEEDDEYDDYREVVEDDKNQVKNQEDLKETEVRLTANIHMMSKHLCKLNEKLINCDKDKRRMFVCIGAKTGLIKECSKFEESEVALPICSQVNTNYLVTCGITSNVNLCLLGEEQHMVPCENEQDFACLAENGEPTPCKRKTKSKRDQTGFESPENEKFYRLECDDCIIENKFVVIGTPDDVLPETELFTFPIEED